MFRILIVVCCLLPISSWAVEFSSDVKKTTVVELYTSEGCSSCPPADAWLSSLKSDPRLFKTLLPLAFHVDYWDRLGWPDRFASSDFSQRQRSLVRQNLLSQVYTPGIVIDSQEWRGWFKGKRQVPSASDKPGRLSASVNSGQMTIHFDSDDRYTAHVALLGMGLKTDVAAGENRGRELNHDFVVLDTMQQQGRSDWEMTLPATPQQGQKRTAVAIWLTKPDSLSVIQATGGYLDE